jgi:two-component system response regulator GlrR
MAKILVIDDDPDIVKVISMVLKENGHNVESAETAEEAIIKLNSNPPDLITLDIQMPGKGGLAVANELARQKLNIPFVLCTGSILNDPIEAFELFVVRHLYAGTLKKPMELNDITNIVEKGLMLGSQLKNIT